MKKKFIHKQLNIITLMTAAIVCLGVIECPTRIAHITFRNYAEYAVNLYIDTVHITTLKQNDVEHWDIKYFPPPYLTLFSSGESKDFNIGPFFDSIVEDTTFLHIHRIEGRVNDSIIAGYIFPYFEIMLPDKVLPPVDTIIVFE